MSRFFVLADLNSGKCFNCLTISIKKKNVCSCDRLGRQREIEYAITFIYLYEWVYFFFVVFVYKWFQYASFNQLYNREHQLNVLNTYDT